MIGSLLLIFLVALLVGVPFGWLLHQSSRIPSGRFSLPVPPPRPHSRRRSCD